MQQVTSGDCVVIKALVPGKNLEKQVMLSNITAPRMGRRSNDKDEVKDEVCQLKLKTNKLLLCHFKMFNLKKSRMLSRPESFYEKS